MLGFILLLFGALPVDARFATTIVDADDVVLLYEHDGERYGSLGAVVDESERTGKHLMFAANGGMYHPDRRPVGLFVEHGKQRAKIVMGKSSGNFGWKPNGVFVIDKKGAKVVTTEAYDPKGVIWATQSGPMLLIDGVMHEGFKPDSIYTNIRNGVGVLPDGKVAFVISREDVTFHALATHFAKLGCKDALYFDGSVSRTYWPAGGLTDRGGDFGVIVAVFAD